MTKNYFSRKEEWCPCCHSGGLVPDFRNKLNKAREIAGIPFVLNSAFRCAAHNAEVAEIKALYPYPAEPAESEAGDESIS